METASHSRSTSGSPKTARAQLSVGTTAAVQATRPLPMAFPTARLTSVRRAARSSGSRPSKSVGVGDVVEGDQCPLDLGDLLVPRDLPPIVRAQPIGGLVHDGGAARDRVVVLENHAPGTGGIGLVDDGPREPQVIDAGKKEDILVGLDVCADANHEIGESVDAGVHDGLGHVSLLGGPPRAAILHGRSASVNLGAH